MKVVFDTNIYISALVIPASKAEKAILKILESDDILLISKEIIDEILTVLASKFSKDREFLSRTALFLADIARVVKPSRKINVLKDVADDKIIECAIAGKADFIVTGDKEMLKYRGFEGIKIISFREYIEGV
jgi:putative PIN family toxin of toxin-antitoxin system